VTASSETRPCPRPVRGRGRRSRRASSGGPRRRSGRGGSRSCRAPGRPRQTPRPSSSRPCSTAGHRRSKGSCTTRVCSPRRCSFGSSSGRHPPQPRRDGQREGESTARPTPPGAPSGARALRALRLQRHRAAPPRAPDPAPCARSRARLSVLREHQVHLGEGRRPGGGNRRVRRPRERAAARARRRACGSRRAGGSRRSARPRSSGCAAARRACRTRPPSRSGRSRRRS